ncbi:hypothetical protein CPB83DRAFT_920203 [Crepidotus variabilis]|uniref:Uncharacterized protein n=1 Tax=Crepidotus variabilis TaxID=179855 RepID=A0A9P6EL27_9AGAR|nr:hypothetical protein CPB83DRAFT_920203 [Crepidotus variabilis]
MSLTVPAMSNTRFRRRLAVSLSIPNLFRSGLNVMRVYSSPFVFLVIFALPSAHVVHPSLFVLLLRVLVSGFNGEFMRIDVRTSSLESTFRLEYCDHCCRRKLCSPPHLYSL